MQKLHNPYSPKQREHNRIAREHHAREQKARRDCARYRAELSRLWAMSPAEYRSMSAYAYVSMSYTEAGRIEGKFYLDGPDYEKWLHNAFRAEYPTQYADFMRSDRERAEAKAEKRAQCKNSLRPVRRTGGIGSHPLGEKRRAVSDEGVAKLEAMFEAERVRLLAEETAPKTRAPRASKMSQADFDKLTAKRTGGAK